MPTSTITEATHAEVLDDLIEKPVDELNDAYDKLGRVDDDDPEGTTARVAADLIRFAEEIIQYASGYTEA